MEIQKAMTRHTIQMHELDGNLIGGATVSESAVIPTMQHSYWNVSGEVHHLLCLNLLTFWASCSLALHKALSDSRG